MPAAKPIVPLSAEQQKVVAANVGLVYKMVLTRRVPDQYRDDAIGAGTEALIRAAKGFDPAFGFQFSTYACTAIIKAIGREVHRQRRGGRNAVREADFDRPDEYRSPILNHATCDVDELEHSDLVSAVRRFLPLLSIRSELVISRRFGIGCERQTLRDIGRTLRITQERVRQIELSAIRDLRRLIDT